MSSRLVSLFVVIFKNVSSSCCIIILVYSRFYFAITDNTKLQNANTELKEELTKLRQRNEELTTKVQWMEAQRTSTAFMEVANEVASFQAKKIETNIAATVTAGKKEDNDDDKSSAEEES